MPSGDPSLTSAAAWLLAGAAHHTVMTTALGIEVFEDLARMSGTELVTIDRKTSVSAVERELRWNAVYHRMASGV